MSNEPQWLELDAILALHDRSILRHGGPPGLRDRGLLESALGRAYNRFHYEGVQDIKVLAATYAGAVSSNHPFIDGNKRTAFESMLLFLRLNGFRLTASVDDAVSTMLAVAAGEMDIDALAVWIEANSRAA